MFNFNPELNRQLTDNVQAVSEVLVAAGLAERVQGALSDIRKAAGYSGEPEALDFPSLDASAAGKIAPSAAGALLFALIQEQAEEGDTFLMLLDLYTEDAGLKNAEEFRAWAAGKVKRRRKKTSSATGSTATI